jgi:hypothetical protein
MTCTLPVAMICLYAAVFSDHVARAGQGHISAKVATPRGIQAAVADRDVYALRHEGASTSAGAGVFKRYIARGGEGRVATRIACTGGVQAATIYGDVCALRHEGAAACLYAAELQGDVVASMVEGHVAAARGDWVTYHAEIRARRSEGAAIGVPAGRADGHVARCGSGAM